VQIQAAWNQGKDVVLSPGRYVISTGLVGRRAAISAYQPPPALRGVNRDLVVLTRVHNPNDYQDALVFGRGGYGGTISDLTVDCTTDPGAFVYVTEANDPELNPNFQRLKLIDAAFPKIDGGGAAVNGALYEDMETVGCGGFSNADHLMLHNVSWRRPPNSPINYFNEWSLGGDQTAMVNCDWDLTCRGICLTNSTNSYFNSLTFERLIFGVNGNEGILTETNGPRNDLFTHVQYHGGHGPVLNVWYATAINNIFRGFDVEGSNGCTGTTALALLSSGQAQTGNVFDTWEMRNTGGIQIIGASGNTFRNFAFVNPRPSQGSWNPFDAAMYGPRNLVMGKGVAGNSFDRRTFVVFGLPASWKVGVNGN
jgi:hypothetical protein